MRIQADFKIPAVQKQNAVNKNTFIAKSQLTHDVVTFSSNAPNQSEISPHVIEVGKDKYTVDEFAKINPEMAKNIREFLIIHKAFFDSLKVPEDKNSKALEYYHKYCEASEKLADYEVEPEDNGAIRFSHIKNFINSESRQIIDNFEKEHPEPEKFALAVITKADKLIDDDKLVTANNLLYFILLKQQHNANFRQAFTRESDAKSSETWAKYHDKRGNTDLAAACREMAKSSRKNINRGI